MKVFKVHRYGDCAEGMYIVAAHTAKQASEIVCTYASKSIDKPGGVSELTKLIADTQSPQLIAELEYIE